MRLKETITETITEIIRGYDRMKPSFFHFFIFSFFLLLVACSRGLLTHKAAREAAESYYQMLIKGDYRGFASGYAHMENMPADYLDQLEDATAQFMSEEPMRDLIAVSVLSDSLGEDSTAFVMLQLQFRDSIFEEIQVPLILGEDGWMMN